MQAAAVFKQAAAVFKQAATVFNVIDFRVVLRTEQLSGQQELQLFLGPVLFLQKLGMQLQAGRQAFFR